MDFKFEDDREANRFDATPHFDSAGVPATQVALVDAMEPPMGSWAATARIMARSLPFDEFDWDAWKDEMKEEVA